MKITATPLTQRQKDIHTIAQTVHAVINADEFDTPSRRVTIDHAIYICNSNNAFSQAYVQCAQSVYSNSQDWSRLTIEHIEDVLHNSLIDFNKFDHSIEYRKGILISRLMLLKRHPDHYSFEEKQDLAVILLLWTAHLFQLTNLNEE